jgi:hypothetical protein
MTVHDDDRTSAPLREVLAYLAKLRPLLKLWGETFDSDSILAYWIVGRRLAALLQQAAKMDVPVQLLDAHQTLVLKALAPALGLYLAMLMDESLLTRDRLHAAAIAGMDTFQEQLARQVVAMVHQAGHPSLA